MKISVSKNELLVRQIRNKLADNGNYCPCALVHNDDTKCMCKEFRDQIRRNEAGSCHCGLYEATNE